MISPSVVFRFQGVANFDAAFLVMTAGMLLTLPSGLVAGLYRARGLYGRVVWLQSWATLVGQLAQLVAIVVTGSLLAVTIAFVATQMLIAIYLLTIDVSRLFPFLRGAPAPSFRALGHGSVSQGNSVRDRRRNGTGFAQPAGAAGQCAGV